MNELSSARAAEIYAHSPECQPRHALVLHVSYDRVRAILLSVALIILTLGLFRELWIYAFAADTPLGKVRFISLGSDNSLPEWWSVVQLLIAVGLLALNGLVEPERRWRMNWYVLAAIFVFLSIDESAGVHELVMDALKPYGFTGFLKYIWVVPYGLASIVVGALFLPFVLGLPPEIRWRVILAGAVFVGGALGMESVTGYLLTQGYHLPSLLATVVEEGGEIIGILIFILALLKLLKMRCRSVTATL